MKINNSNLNPDTKKFEELSVGDVFQYSKCWYMKIDCLWANKNSEYRNAVRLDTGRTYFFESMFVCYNVNRLEGEVK